MAVAVDDLSCAPPPLQPASEMVAGEGGAVATGGTWHANPGGPEEEVPVYYSPYQRQVGRLHTILPYNKNLRNIKNAKFLADFGVSYDHVQVSLQEYYRQTDHYTSQALRQLKASPEFKTHIEKCLR